MAKGKMKANVQLLVEKRTKLLAEIEALKNKLSGLEMAIALLGGEGSASQEAPKANLKATILDLLTEAGATGLNATSAVEFASNKGVKLNRGSVASNLSRMAKEKTIVYDGDKYRLPQFVRGPVGVVRSSLIGETR